MNLPRAELTLRRGRDVPRAPSWLAPGERVRLGALQPPRARRDYRLGRWTAKHGVARYLGADCSPAAVEIRRAENGAPLAWWNGRPAACALSLSHRAGAALCAVGPEGLGLGCDLEWVEPRSQAFIADFLAPAEARLTLALQGPARSRLATLFWSAKESALKALGIGLDVDTREVNVRLGPLATPEGFGPMVVRVPGVPEPLTGWWRTSDGWIFTLSATAPTEAPLHPVPVR
ncbi:MAG: 4'-phosphopantetheinyl transferase superfamily protein [bacterium]|nr:4'-phosphopantetheinyl transferase superfamily protein [bacterium]